jgi:hypothetical protein
MHVPWAAVTAASENLSVGVAAFPNMDTYKIPLPQSLAEAAQIGIMTFSAISSRLAGLNKDTLD